MTTIEHGGQVARVNDEGYLEPFEDWNDELACALADREGISNDGRNPGAPGGRLGAPGPCTNKPEKLLAAPRAQAEMSLLLPMFDYSQFPKYAITRQKKTGSQSPTITPSGSISRARVPRSRMLSSRIVRMRTHASMIRPSMSW